MRRTEALFAVALALIGIGAPAMGVISPRIGAAMCLVAIFLLAHVAIRLRSERKRKSLWPNIKSLGAEHRIIFINSDGTISTQPEYEGAGGGRQAIVGTFINQPTTSGAAAVHDVRASVALISSQLPIYSGWWLGESLNRTNLDFGPVRELILAYKDDDGSICGIEDRRESADRFLAPRHHLVIPNASLLGALSATVQLFTDGQLLYDACFFIDRTPFSGELVWEHNYPLTNPRT